MELSAEGGPSALGFDLPFPFSNSYAMIHIKYKEKDGDEMSLTTKRALADSLKRLLAKRSLDKITVKDIVENCGVNRQTFYYYFHDIYDLMEWTFRNKAEELLNGGTDYNDWLSGVKSLMEYLKEDRALVLNIYHSVSHELISNYLKKLIRPYVLQVVVAQAKELERPAAEANVEFLTDIYTLTATGIVMEWISQQMKIDGTEERLHKLYVAMDGSIQFMLRNLGET